MKKISCQPNGLKNHGRSDHHSAGRSQLKRHCASVERTQQADASGGPTRASAMTAGTIARTTMYIGRMSK